MLPSLFSFDVCDEVQITQFALLVLIHATVYEHCKHALC